MGLILGLSAGVFFAISTIFARLGQRGQYEDDGMFMSVLVNVLTLGVVALFATAPAWNTAGIAALAVSGLVGTLGGRTANFRAVRLIGPSRANAFLTATPLTAAILGFFVLGEGVGVVDALGGILVAGGLLWLVKRRSSARALVETEQESKGTPLTRYLVAAAAPTFFGIGFVLRKWGLVYFPNSMIGAFIGSATAFTALLAVDAARGLLPNRLRLNFRRIPWWFILAGVATSAALLCQFAAFAYLPAWVVGVLQGTQGIWTLLLSYVFIRSDEQLDSAAVGSVLLVAAGVLLIGLQT